VQPRPPSNSLLKGALATRGASSGQTIDQALRGALRRSSPRGADGRPWGRSLRLLRNFTPSRPLAGPSERWPRWAGRALAWPLAGRRHNRHDHFRTLRGEGRVERPARPLPKIRSRGTLDPAMRTVVKPLGFSAVSQPRWLVSGNGLVRHNNTLQKQILNARSWRRLGQSRWSAAGHGGAWRAIP